MATPDGLSEADFDRIFQACACVRLNDYPPYILRELFVEVLRPRDPVLAARVRRMTKTQFQALLDSLRARRVACSFGGVG
jgi:hypothetical protein